MDQVTDQNQNQGQNQNQNQSLGWRAALPDEYKEHEFVKTFQKPGDFVKTALDIKTEHDNLKTKLESAIFKPGDKATPEEMAAFHKSLGVPEDPKEYEFPKGDGVEHDEKMTAWARDVFHKAGLNKNQASTISQAWDSFMQGVAKQMNEAEEKLLSDTVTALKDEWKADYDKNFELSKRAFKKWAEADLGEFKAHPVLIKAFYRIGKDMAEDTSMQSQPQGQSKDTPRIIYNKSPAPPNKE